MVTIYIHGKPYQADERQNLLQACLSLGFDLPYFCWHPAMHSVGACRQCAVKLFKDETQCKGRIVMACMTPVAEGMRISIDDPEAKAFRQGIVEMLMTNHPHDCPVCDEGGECHLQDMTVMTGQVVRRFRFDKRTFRNQDLGPFVNHEMNRCIACYRCVRFYRDYAGGRDLDVMGWNNTVYFGRHADGPLESEFSGNLVEVCPTGVFTDKTLKRHYTRNWDLQTAPAICVHCSLGCNTIPGERYGTLRRIRNRFHEAINGYFLCDRGRYGYEFVNDEHRIRQPLVRRNKGTPAQPVNEEQAIQAAAEILKGGKKVIGIGSPRATLEANFALRKLVGEDAFYPGVPDAQAQAQRQVVKILSAGAAPAASLADVEQAEAALVLGEDPTHFAPRLALALRQASLRQPREEARKLHIADWDDAAIRKVMNENRGPLFIASYRPTRLDDAARACHRAAPADLARLGQAVAAAISQSPPAQGLADEVSSLTGQIASALLAAKSSVIVASADGLSPEILEAAAQVAGALTAAGHKTALCLPLPHCNSMGLAMMDGGNISQAAKAIASGDADTVVILENDLHRSLDAATAEAILSAKHIIVLDALHHATAARANVLLPAATFAEASGTLVNHEGRAQRSFATFVPDAPIRESWRWLRDIRRFTGAESAARWNDLDDVLQTLARELPVFAGAKEAAPSADARFAGQLVPRQPHRYSGRTAMTAHIDIHEPKPPADADAPLAFSMEGYPLQPPATLLSIYWSPGWNSCQSLNKFQEEVGGPLRGRAGGVRLIQPARPAALPPASMPPAFVPQRDQWLILPAHHIFGSEELSALSPGIAERSPKAYVAVGSLAAQELKLSPGDPVELAVGDVRCTVAIAIEADLPEGVAIVPAGLPSMPVLPAPAWGIIRKLAAAEGRP